jgi:hypothetical protein
MKWLLKVLSALARPLGISSPDDLRSHASPRTGKESSLRPAPGGTSEPHSPNNPPQTH